MPKILVADDDHSARELVRLTLDKEGYEIIEAIDGGSAYTTAASEKPDLILLDVMMPVMDGYGVLQKLKANQDTEPIPVIMLTVNGQPKDELSGIEAGATDYVTKPFARDELLDRVRMALSYPWVLATRTERRTRNREKPLLQGPIRIRPGY